MQHRYDLNLARASKAGKYGHENSDEFDDIDVEGNEEEEAVKVEPDA